MSRVNLLIQARESYSVKFREFTRIVAHNKQSNVLFFEGEDEKYYGIRVKNINPSLTWFGINCGGKQKVLELRDKIQKNNTYKESNCMYFVDADFDDNTDILSLDDVYVTPTYSIENFYVAKEMFIDMLNSEFNISTFCEERDCFSRIVQFFDANFNLFLEHISDFNYWIHSYRILEKSGVVNGSLNINNIKLTDLVSLNSAGVIKKYDSSKIHDLFPDCGLDTLDFSTSISLLKTTKKNETFRGKQILEFYRLLIELIKTDRCKKEGRVFFQRSGKVKLSLSKVNILSELSQYAQTPSCLSQFIKKLN
jgi:hypothetical protein